MKDQKIFQLIGDLEKKVMMGNMALNKFAHESSDHFNSLVLSFNACKGLLVEKGVMTDEEIDSRIKIEVEKAIAAQNGEAEIMEETSEEIIEDPDGEESEETPPEEEFEEEQEEG